MNEIEIEKVRLKTYFLINYKSLLEDKVVSSFLELLNAIKNDNCIENNFKKYNNFIFNLNDRDLSCYIKEILPQTRQNERNLEELSLINELGNVKYEDIKNIFYQKFQEYGDVIDRLPYFKNSELRLNENDIKYLKDFRTFIFQNNQLNPIEMTEPLSFKDLKGYEAQKEIIYNNTKALLEGKKVNNILLYGDAGCGKSTTVRALLNEFPEIKIIQIFKSDIINLDKLYEILRKEEGKFVIFADDISFVEDDENLSTMKAVLEGSLIQCPSNAVIYATTNRRHLVKETFHSRIGDEIHLNDTLNEISSLSERFGINLLFAKPSNDEYNDIVLKLAKEYELNIKEDELINKAQKLALTKGSRSPRVARQLIDALRIDMEI